MNRRTIRILAVVTVIAVAIWALATGALDRYLAEDALRDRIRGWGALGPVGFVLAMWAIQPFGLPGVLFMVPASVVWSAPVAIALSWIGNMGASWIAFEATRRLGQEWVAEQIPERLHRFDERLANGGVWPVLMLRLVTGQIPAADWLLGVSSVRRVPFLVGTGLGIIPGIVVTVLYGADLFGWLRDHRGVGLVLIGLAVVRRLVIRQRSRGGIKPLDPAKNSPEVG